MIAKQNMEINPLYRRFGDIMGFFTVAIYRLV